MYDARAVAQQLGIPYYVVNFEQRFEEQVVRPFIDEYLAGRTPIPCTLCNNFVKFDQFLDMAAGIGAERSQQVITRRIERNERPGGTNSSAARIPARIRLISCSDLTQAQLSRTKFPAGAYAEAAGPRAGA